MSLKVSACGLTIVLTLLAGSCAHQPSGEQTTAPALVCGSRADDPAIAVAAQLPVPQPQIVSIDNPSFVDLRPRLTRLGLTPRAQGYRGTCSIFTTCESIEFAYAQLTGEPLRLSTEYLNWAGGQAAGNPSDGNFFHNALAGFEKFGICSERSMPYRKTFDPSHAPSAAAATQAEHFRDATRGRLVIHWIVPWQAGHEGVDDEQFAEIKRVLASGYPVAAGAGHSRLLVGYTDNDTPGNGGGEFITEDSALNRFDKVPYNFVRKEVCDVFWIEAVGTSSASTSPVP